MTDRDGYYLDRPSQAALIELLDQIPDLVEDLTIAITRQDRITGGGPRTRNGSDEQPIPIGLHAMEAADLLHDTLAAWTTHVCEQRHYPRPGNDTLTLGRWLKQHIIALALTEGAEESLDEIQHAIRQARRATDRPAEKVRPVDQALLFEARRQELTATEIEMVAKELGTSFRGLTSKRVHNLRSLEHVQPVRVRGKSPVFNLGEVLEAHLKVPTFTAKRGA